MKNSALRGSACRNDIIIVWQQKAPEKIIREVGIESRAYREKDTCWLWCNHRQSVGPTLCVTSSKLPLHSRCDGSFSRITRGKKGPLEIGLFAEMKIYLDSTTVHIDNAKAKTYKKKRSLPGLGSGGRVWSLEQNVRGQRETYHLIWDHLSLRVLNQTHLRKDEIIIFKWNVLENLMRFITWI